MKLNFALIAALALALGGCVSYRVNCCQLELAVLARPDCLCALKVASWFTEDECGYQAEHRREAEKEAKKQEKKLHGK